MNKSCFFLVSRTIAFALAIYAFPARAAQTVDWGAVGEPTAPPASIHGSYSRGCIAGAVELPDEGYGYHIMRPSRHRNFGHPELIDFITSYAAAVKEKGLGDVLIGDMAQPRGGPMTSGHASHQIGLDVDIWYMQAPAGGVSGEEKEALSAVSLVDNGSSNVAPAKWQPQYAERLKLAASDPVVERIFVNAAIKRQLCDSASGNRDWLAKIRPWWGHADHFHVRLACPSTETDCVTQDPVPAGDGCDQDLAWWFSDDAKAEWNKIKSTPKKQLTLADLPPVCQNILEGN